MKTQVELFIQNTAQLIKIQNFLIMNPDLSYNMTHKFDNTYSSTFDYIPSHDFVNLCGSENLTKDGYISEEGAVNVLINYAKQNNLFHNTYIELNDYLRNILNCYEPALLIDSIPLILRKIFKIKEESSVN